MNDRSDMDRVLSHWFADGPSEMPDRVVDTVADRIGRQRQRRPWRLPWRPFDMNSAMKIGAAVAAVLVLAVAGWNLLPRQEGFVGQPPPTPTPSPTASPTPSPSPASRTAAMVVQQKSISWTAQLPANWGNQGWFVTPSQGPAAPTGIAIGAPGAVNVPTDPCDGEGKLSDYKTPADVVAALGSRKDLVVSPAVDATLGGYSGKHLVVQAPADLSACTDLYIIMAEPSGTGYHAQGPSNKIEMWIVDVDGQPTVFQIESFPGTPPADLAAAQRIMDSVRIRP